MKAATKSTLMKEVARITGIVLTLLVVLFFGVKYTYDKYSLETDEAPIVIGENGLTANGELNPNYSVASDVFVVTVAEGDRVTELVIPGGKIEVQLRSDNRENYSVRFVRNRVTGECKSAVILVPLQDTADQLKDWIERAREEHQRLKDPDKAPPKKHRYQDTI